MTVPEFVCKISVDQNTHFTLNFLERGVSLGRLGEVGARCGEEQGAVQGAQLHVIFDDATHGLYCAGEEHFIFKFCSPR